MILDSTTISPGEGGYGPLSSISIGVWDNSKQLSLIDWAEDEYNRSFSNYNGDGFADFENKTLAEHKAISYSWEGLGYGKTVIIENNKVIFCWILAEIVRPNEFGKILMMFFPLLNLQNNSEFHGI